MLNSVLEKYAEKAKGNKKNPIQVVYSVGGYIGNNLKFLLAIDSKLDQAKSKLDKVLYTHVYSVQKGKLGSYGLLYNSNLTDLKKTIQQCSGNSGISCPSARLKTPEERKFSKATAETKKPTEPVKPAVVKPTVATETLKDDKKEESSNKAVTEKKGSPKEHKATSKPTDKKATGKPDMSAFFSKNKVKEPKAESTDKNKKEQVEVKKEIPVEAKKAPASAKRVVREPSSSEDDENEENKVENRSKKSTVVGNNKRFKLADDADVEKSKPKSQPAAKAKKPPAKPAKKGKDNAAKKPQRKRIQQISDSDSSDGGTYLLQNLLWIK